jgi:ubiquitin carboxyl-terminal hydrolase 7
MNSLLQTLFLTSAFRRAVYNMVVTIDENKDKNVALALQRVFFELQSSDDSVSTLALTKAFGWDTADAFTQHDVQEFNRVLIDNVEEKMKGTSQDAIIRNLMQGKTKMYIRCINVEFESSREDIYYDLQLNVKGLRNVEASLDEFIKVCTGANHVASPASPSPLLLFARRKKFSMVTTSTMPEPMASKMRRRAYRLSPFRPC